MSRALNVLLAAACLALPACSELDNRQLGADPIPREAGVGVDGGIFGLLPECRPLLDQLSELQLRWEQDDSICLSQPSDPSCRICSPLTPDVNCQACALAWQKLLLGLYQLDGEPR